MTLITEVLRGIWESSGFALLDWRNLVMIGVAFAFLVLAIKFKFEPLLLVPIAFGILLANMPGADIIGFDENGIRYLEYEETESYRITEMMINHRDLMVSQLLQEED